MLPVYKFDGSKFWVDSCFFCTCRSSPSIFFDSKKDKLQIIAIYVDNDIATYVASYLHYIFINHKVYGKSKLHIVTFIISM